MVENVVDALNTDSRDDEPMLTNCGGGDDDNSDELADAVASFGRDDLFGFVWIDRDAAFGVDIFSMDEVGVDRLSDGLKLCSDGVPGENNDAATLADDRNRCGSPLVVPTLTPLIDASIITAVERVDVVGRNDDNRSSGNSFSSERHFKIAP